MSVDIQLRKFQNQFKNGVNLDSNPTVFTHFLLGFVGQKMKRLTRVATSWKSDASSTNTFTTVNGQKTITRISGSWIDDGFQIGDDILYNDNSTPFNQQANVIANLTDLVMTCTTNFTFGNTTIDTTVFGTSRLLGVNYLSNFIENDDPVGYISKVDNVSSKKWTGEFTIAEYDALTVINATQSGLVDSWKMGSDSVTIQMVQIPIFANGFIQILEVVETFTITPFFDNISNLEAGIKPDYLIDNASLRSIASFELRLTNLNPIVKHILDDSDNPETDGNVGYYDEHANGFTPIEFSKDSIDYSNASGEDKIVIDELTTITCKINSVNNVLSQGNSQFQMNLVFLNEAIDNNKNIDTNFSFDTVFAVADGSTKSGENGIFTNVEGNIVSDQLVVTADITFTPTQQSLIDEGKYLISIATNDHTLAIDQSVFVNVLMDVNDFVKNNDVPDLMAIDTNFFYEHPHDKGTQGKTDFQGWVEDGILMSTDFTLDLSKGSVINNMNVRLMAFNSITDEDFEIACIPLDFTSAIISGGVQQIDIDSERGFKLVEDSQFNFVKVQTLAKVGNIQHYDLDIGFKLQWMDWQALVQADPVFFDNTELNNGLNRLISNYSALNDYDIVMFIDAEVSNGIVNTAYRFISPGLRTFEYETDDTGSPSTKWSGLIETFDQSTNNLNGNIHGTEKTDIKVTFTASSGLISEAVLYTTMRLEEFQQGGLFNIFELSSFRGSAIDNPLIPLPGQTKTIFTTLASSVEVECSIDFTKLNPSSQYKISARLGTACNESTGCAWQALTSGVVSLIESLSFIDANNGWTCDNISGILNTSDAGQTWTPQVSGVVSQLKSIFFIDANNGWACGQVPGIIIQTIDGGTNWTTSFTPASAGYQEVFFIDANNGWACGFSATEALINTIDGGANWTTQIAGINFFTSIFFADVNNGWACESDGSIINTIDGGTNWLPQVSGVTTSLNDIFFIDSNNGWICGNGGVILNTIDGGVNWTSQVSGTISILHNVFFTDSNNGWICGDNGTILNTTDEGVNWNIQTSGILTSLQDIHMISATNGFAVGAAGEILKYICTIGCNILDGGKLKEDGTQKLTEDGKNKILE